MTSRQLAEWMAYAAVEPFGEARADYRAAHALAVLVNLLTGRDAPPVAVQDLLPRVGALADDDRAQWEAQAGEGEAVKHPNVIMFERIVGL